MNETVAEIGPPGIGQQATPVVPPLPHRRPRVREVSSRFMSPVVSSSSSSSSGDLHLLPAKSPNPKHHVSTPNPGEPQARRQQQQQQRSKSAQRCRQEAEPLGCADENIPETIRSLDTPLGLHGKGLVSVQRKQSAAAVKLFKENGGGRAEQPSSDISRSKGMAAGKPPGRGANCVPSRPDTPIVTGTDRIVPSRFRLTPKNNGLSTPVSAAAKLLQSSGLSLSAQPSNPNSHVSGDSSQEPTSLPAYPSSVYDNATASADKTAIEQGSSCNDSPVPVQSCNTLSLPDFRSSMPEVDMLPTVSTRLLAGRSCDSSKFSSSPCHRSLTLPLSSCEPSLYKFSEKSMFMASKPLSNSVKMGSICLPPVPPGVKPGADARKGRKGFSHQEDVHYLKLLQNRYMQWRFVNAKAETSMHAQRKEVEKKIYSLGIKISDLRNAVERKRIELQMLQRARIISTILEAHMPCLEEWFVLEEEFSSSLSGATNALLNASLQLPVGGNVQADVRDVGEALKSATAVMEMIGFHAQIFVPKAEELDNLISELAKVISGERALIEQCGHLLFKAHVSQMEECSLRGHLIQSQRNNHNQPQQQ